MIERGSKKRFKEEAKREQSLANFKDRFPQALFQHYKDTMHCETFFYQSGSGMVQGFMISSNTEYVSI